MFARSVSLRLRSNSAELFTWTIDTEMIPPLRRQKSFQDEITFIAPGGKEAIAISLWDQKQNAEAYNRGTYPQVLSTLANVVEGTPQVQTYQVSNSTFHKIAVPSAA